MAFAGGTVCGALLAAGKGSRFDAHEHKLLADLDGVPVWRRSLAHLFDAACDHTLVVTGACSLRVPAPAAEIHNPSWAHGQATSLAAARQAAEHLDAELLVIGLADQPFVTAAAWKAVIAAAQQPGSSPIVVADYQSGPGPNPVCFHRSVWRHLPSHGDEGARQLLRTHPEWVSAVACLGSPADIDTVEDLQRWKS